MNEEGKNTGRKTEIDAEQSHKLFLDLLPDTINGIRDMIANDETPPSAKVALFNIVLERALGKAEVPVKISSDQENIRIAEQKLMALVMEFRGEREIGMIEEGAIVDDEKGDEE